METLIATFETLLVHFNSLHQKFQFLLKIFSNISPHTSAGMATPTSPKGPTDSSSTSSVRCVEGRIVRPGQREEESPSTACNSGTV